MGAGVDVLVITALKEEYEAARATPGLSGWEERDADRTAPFSVARLGSGLSVALARPVRMGGRSAGAITTTLTDRLEPACLAMCGVCAGNPAGTAQGDVIVAAPAYEWDEGKHTERAFLADPQQFPLDASWVRAVQDFTPSTLPSHGPATDREAAVWVLETLHKGQDPRTHAARRRYLPGTGWGAQLERLESEGLIRWLDGRFALTEGGRDRIQRLLYMDVEGPEKLPYAVQAGPMASGSAVMATGDIWTRLEAGQRRLLALDMEAATIATVAQDRKVPHWLVAKGVSDHADAGKDDRFKAFAARASADVLFALLGRLLGPAPAPPDPPIPDQVRQQILRQLTYYWPDVADAVGVPSYVALRFRPGDEPHELWTWLRSRHRLADLPGVLDEIGRPDLAGLMRRHL
ncbi:hypothetical protein AB0J83_39685 [Actinoplanes sp. NPDC049596]|uniref:5'-methylthioadenosine/S-adenosylhomocysteine nucleosidase family protein n=1 Tax=unclassified Actinoplanes TaxID=2626549 RepID=UPI003436DBB0